MDDVINDFIAETRESLESLDSQLVQFEQHPQDPKTLGEVFRLIHTIKGTCGFLGLTRLQTVAHAAENVLGGFRDGSLSVTRDAVSAVLDTVDVIRVLTDALSADGAEPAGDDGVLIARLEAVMNQEPTAAAAPRAPAPSDNRKLIDRLGGDSTLDMAVEMALSALKTHPLLASALEGADPDGLQAAIRDCLSALARDQQGARALSHALANIAREPIGPTATAAAFDCVAATMGVLDVDADAVEALRALAAAPAISETVQARPDPVVMSVPTVDRDESAAKPSGGGDKSAQTIRVGVDALEHLMTVASELVLIRNQLIQTLRLDPESPFAAPLNRLNQVTSELQEGVMTTRMQPINGAWAKLPRMVRDLAQDLGKSIELATFGQETELDRQVLELIKDPLTHMIRNAADHGLEAPAERRAAGKPETGRITLKALHEGDAIVIEVADDGRGISAEKVRRKAVASGLITAKQAELMSDAEVRQMIFLPGLSTAAEVTAVSGRGVGMDVVRSNIEKIGGVIEVASAEGSGSRFTIRIPLTLTIVSALIVECCGERFAMPQSSIVELVSASDGSGRMVEHIDGAAVLRLRDRLLPLISLRSLLALESSEQASETCIVVARVGSFTFGVIVDKVFDTEEIVVKPVATVLRHIKTYSGATILGDGDVILILDLKGISVETGASQTGVQDEPKSADAPASLQTTAILLFRPAATGLKAVPLSNVARIEEVSSTDIERIDGRTVIQYRNRLVPIVNVDAGPVAQWRGDERRPLLVFAQGDQAVGLLVHEIVDIVRTPLSIELKASGRGVLGSLIISEQATELIDVDYYWRQAFGGGAATAAAMTARPRALEAPRQEPAAAKRLLLIDRSSFSRLLLHPLLNRAGYDVVHAEGAEAALELYDAGEMFDLIMADTSDPDIAAECAAAFGRASAWHATPIMEMSLGRQDSGADEDSAAAFLATVREDFAGMRGAA